MEYVLAVTFVAAIAFLAVAGSADAASGCGTHRCFERVAARKCSQTRPRWCVERAIVTYRLTGWEAAWMRRIPGCESGWNPYNRNGGSGSTGLFQFLPSTWATTRYARRSIWSAKWQALAAAWMLRQGRAGEWVCR